MIGTIQRVFKTEWCTCKYFLCAMFVPVGKVKISLLVVI